MALPRLARLLAKPAKPIVENFIHYRMCLKPVVTRHLSSGAHAEPMRKKALMHRKGFLDDKSAERKSTNRKTKYFDSSWATLLKLIYVTLQIRNFLGPEIVPTQVSKPSTITALAKEKSYQI